MKIHFKTLAYQKSAVDAVVNCFKGQLRSTGVEYTLDKGRVVLPANLSIEDTDDDTHTGFKNAPIGDLDKVLENIRLVQAQGGLEQSSKLITDDIDKGKNRNLTTSPLNLDIEMETGTGKTYCYIRTMFELNKQYGWSKFIVVVPSIAIREGVHKSFNMMQDHFVQEYGKKAHFFIYDSNSLHLLDSFSSSSNISVMIINVQAFNAFQEDAKNNAARRIYMALDEFQSRRPIDVISSNRPILIIDEPQKIQAEKTLSALANFKPLFILRYSATHKRQYNLIHRLDALDAYNQKLVKKISVKGIEVHHLPGNHSYLYLQDIIVSKSLPVARLELEIKTSSGTYQRQIRKVGKGDNLFELSGEADQYRDRYIVSDIDALSNTISFTNGVQISVGQSVGNKDVKTTRTLQIREAIRSHLEKEKILFHQGIKVLSLFFIDEVAKYRQYDANGQAQDGEYADIFKREYQRVLQEEYLDLNIENDPYQDYLKNIDVDKTHNGYFSIDKKSHRLIDPSLGKARSEEASISTDVDAYDLILKDKERLLSFEEPTRFIFSHSALREGWDNPNVFVICTLKHSDNTISRRQEVGRGLRLAVNKSGERIDANFFRGAIDEVHRINTLTVITDESYTEFTKNLQSEIAENLKNRPTQASVDYFKDRILTQPNGERFVLNDVAANRINKYLVRNDYVDDNDYILDTYTEARKTDSLAPLPEELQPYSESIFKLIDSIHNPSILAEIIENANAKRANKINPDNINRKEFQALWNRINKKAIYQIKLNSEQLINDAVREIEAEASRRDVFVPELTYTIRQGEQTAHIKASELRQGNTFEESASERIKAKISSYSTITYDLIGEIAEGTQLTRRTIATILTRINKVIFNQFKNNPEAFIREMIRLINQQQVAQLLQDLEYSLTQQEYTSNEIFMDNEVPTSALSANHHVWDFVPTDSTIERNFAEALDKAKEVVVYAKLPPRFVIPTPFGNYNPDWAIACDEDKVKNIYFIAETKGSSEPDALRTSEYNKIQSAKRFFDKINETHHDKEVKYGVIANFAELIDILNAKTDTFHAA